MWPQRSLDDATQKQFQLCMIDKKSNNGTIMIEKSLFIRNVNF